MYEVRYVYAPYFTVYFRKKADAIEFSKNEVPQTIVYKRTLFGWKIVLDNRR